MAIKEQAGFTLIEIIIAMAISSSLAVIALMGFSAMRSQVQFSDAVERLRERTVQTRTEANSSVQLASGDQPNLIAFGRIMTFTPGSGIVKIQTLRTSSTESPTDLQAVNLTADNAFDYTIPWGLTYQGGKDAGGYTTKKRQVAFIRSPRDGSLHSIVSPPNGWTLHRGYYYYSDFMPSGVPAGASLRVGYGTRTATLDIDPATNGIGRSF